MWSEKWAPNTSSFQSGFGCRLSSGHGNISRSSNRNVDTVEEFRTTVLRATHTLLPAQTLNGTHLTPTAQFPDKLVVSQVMDWIFHGLVNSTK